MKSNKAIFFDINRKRWPKIKAWAYFLWLMVTIIFLALVISVVINPVFQVLSLPSTSFLPNWWHIIPNFINLNGDKARLALMKKQLKIEIWKQKIIKKTVSKYKRPSNSLRIWYYVNWDDASFNSLKSNLDSLDVIAGEFLHLSDWDWNITEDDPIRQKMVCDYITAHKPDTKIFALVNNYTKSGWDWESLATSIKTEENRQKMVTYFLKYVQSNKLNWISIDFENVLKNSQNDLVLLMGDLTTEFHKHGLIVTINLPAQDDDYPYLQYANNSDYLIIMAYDEHWSTGNPWPISSLDWYQNILENRLKDIPSEKIILALWNYAYDWTEWVKDSQTRTFEETILTAKESEWDITMDEKSINPTFDYEDENNKIHHVWMLDATTTYDQMKLAEDYSTSWFALWRLWWEDPSVWSFFGKNKLDSNDAQKLSKVEFKYDVDYEWQWEILKVTQKPQIWERKISYDVDSWLIDWLEYIKFPSSYVISRYWSKSKELAITFDDWPDPIYTPKILDVLKNAWVHATFFIIWSNAEKNTDIISREYNEWHNIWNHTFTHPNIWEITNLQLRLELSATERLIESITGHKSHLFRSPYAEDSEPDTADQVKPIEDINTLWYINVWMQIDPNDWRSPGVDQIVNNTISLAEKNIWNVILLHDAGWDRSQTVAALPLIISKLKQKWYKFVSISELLWKSRNDLMPPLTKNEKIFRLFNNIWFGIISILNYLIHFLFVFGILLWLSRLLFIVILAVYQKNKKKKIFLSSKDDFRVAVIVPAYNEEKVINQTILSLLCSNHPKDFEVIVVDDWSNDDTYNVAMSEFSLDERVKIYRIENSWKPWALNFWIEKTNADILITLDADTVFSKDTITNLIRHFEDEEIWAVAGNAKVWNRLNLLTRWQALEYIVSQNLDRRAFVILNCITVVPWAVWAWRADLVKKIWWFSGDTLAEDSDLTIEIRKMWYKIVYEEDAIGLTEAPDSISTFIRQRYRWMFGTLQATWKHKDAIFRNKYWWLGWFALPNIFIYQIIFPFVSPIMDLLMIITLISSAIDKYQHPSSFSKDSLEKILFYYCFFLLIDYITWYIAFKLEKKEDKMLLLWLFLQRFFYRQIMYIVAFKSIKASLKWHEVWWNKLERKATVQFDVNNL